MPSKTAKWQTTEDQTNMHGKEKVIEQLNAALA